jgi:hypothetical protein
MSGDFTWLMHRNIEIIVVHGKIQKDRSLHIWEEIYVCTQFVCNLFTKKFNIHNCLYHRTKSALVILEFKILHSKV